MPWRRLFGPKQNFENFQNFRFPAAVVYIYGLRKKGSPLDCFANYASWYFKQLFLNCTYFEKSELTWQWLICWIPRRRTLERGHGSHWARGSNLQKVVAKAYFWTNFCGISSKSSGESFSGAKNPKFDQFFWKKWKIRKFSKFRNLEGAQWLPCPPIWVPSLRFFLLLNKWATAK